MKHVMQSWINAGESLVAMVVTWMGMGLIQDHNNRITMLSWWKVTLDIYQNMSKYMEVS